MKKSLLSGIVLLCLVTWISLGCTEQSDSAHEERSVLGDLTIRTMIPAEIVYQNDVYVCTGKTVGVQRVSPENLALVGTAFPATESRVSKDSAPARSTYEVYDIAGENASQAVAVKFLAISLSGKDGPYFCWLRYERKE
ncbi:MAG: hypothetical protein N3B14_03385 [Thermoleophilia bacterium]|nr:hypothetical protein [Thermoleophilia bacterium]